MDTKELQTAVAHSDDKYQCERMSDCPYTGTTVINKIPWGNCPAVEDGETEEEETVTEEDNTKSEEEEDEAGPTTRAPERSEVNQARKPGFFKRIKRLFRK